MTPANTHRTVALLPLFALLFSVLAAAETLHVPAAYPTIQAAIDAAADGDVVEIACGTYTGAGNKNLDFLGKAITVRSVTGEPECVVIDCEGDGRGFYFHSGEGPASVVEGVTITRGRVYSTSPGGSRGGAVHCAGSDPTLKRCNILENHGIDGGGIYCSDSSPALTHCTFIGNAGSKGGGVFCSTGGNPTLTNCVISANTSEDGGGVYVERGAVTLQNCAIVRNWADNDGGGCFFGYDSNPTLINCTLNKNGAADAGGAAYCYVSTPVLRNCIMWDSVPHAIYSTTSSWVATYCNIEHGAGASWFGEGCIELDPRLTPDGHLTLNSPCIDAGDPDEAPPGYTDSDGEPRLIGPALDIGADEWLDTDNDGLPDSWEQREFGDPVSGTPSGDDDSDGRTNRQEYEDGSDPFIGARTYFVAPDGNDGWDGLCATWDGAACGPKATIQAAIDACAPNDEHEVILANGTYSGEGNRDLDYRGKAIIVRSASGDPDACLIDCEALGRGLNFHSGEGENSIVNGIGIINGYASDASIGGDHGGGIRCARLSSPTISNCVISESTAGSGAGVYLTEGSAATLTHCEINKNAGRGVSTANSTSVLTNCTITNNTGGGISVTGGSPVVMNCLISKNTGHNGGGILSYSADLTLSGCMIIGNTSTNGGGVMSWSLPKPIITNCTIINNVASANGGGVWCLYSAPEIRNCIVWSNVPNSIGYSSYWPDVTYSNVEGTSNSTWIGDGCIDVDPRVAPDGHLTATSPCINAGDPNGSYSGETDIDGETRRIGLRVDMGADEWRDADVDGLPDWWETHHFGDPYSGDPHNNEDDDDRTNVVEYENGANPFIPPQVYYVAPDGNDDWNGLCPISDDGVCGPKATIQAAVDACTVYEGDEVVLANGTYTGAGNRDIDSRGKTITIRSASWNPALCIIDCEGQGRGFYFYRGAESVLRGVSITAGLASDDSLGGANGGGLYCDFSSPTLIDLIITGNTAGENGGGLYCAYHSHATISNCVIAENNATSGGGAYCHRSSPSLNNCTLSKNTATRNGGGMYCRDFSIPVFKDVVVSENVADRHGGGLSCFEFSSPEMTNCTIVDNTAATNGGAIYLDRCQWDIPVFTGCAISGNSAGSAGGALYCDASAPRITNSVISGNSSGSTGGALYGTSSGTIYLTNCAVTDNVASNRGGALYCRDSSLRLSHVTLGGNVAGTNAGLLYADDCNLYFNNCIAWSNYPVPMELRFSTPTVIHSNIQDAAAEPWFGPGCIDADPLFVDPDGPDDDPATWQDNDYRLAAGSPCIDAGDNAVVPRDEFDLDADGDTTEPVPWDLAGLPRFVDDPDTPDSGAPDPALPGLPLVDMGAYEVQLRCPADLTGDAFVGGGDLNVMLAAFGAPCPTPADCGGADLTGDGAVDGGDLNVLLASWGPCEE